MLGRVRDGRPPRCTVPAHSSRQNHSSPVWGTVQRVGRLTEMCPRRTSQLGGGCRYRPAGLFQDLRAHPSSHATPNKTSAILSETGNKGNCYVAYEYKYTRSIAMEWTSVLFHRRSLNSGVAHTDQWITYIVYVFVSAAVVPPQYKLVATALWFHVKVAGVSLLTACSSCQ